MMKFIMKLFGYKLFCTQFKAENSLTGEIETYCGEQIYAKDFIDAQTLCDIYFPYLKVVGHEA